MANPRTKPLLIVDGKIQELGTIKTLNPDDIKSITVLKDSEAITIYGSEGQNGVIVMTTRNIESLISVVDQTERIGVPGATIKFIAEKDTIMLSADEKGQVKTNKLKANLEYQVSVTAVGYKPYSSKYNIGQIHYQEIGLEKVVRVLNECFVSAIVCVRKKSMSGECRYKENPVEVSEKPFEAKRISLLQSIYPNPVQRGQSLTIETLSENEKTLKVVITDLSGKLLLSQTKNLYKGNNRFLINTDNRWTGGIYLVQLIGEDGELIKQAKLQIQ